VAWVEEVFVRRQDRGHGIGRALMSAFEQRAAVQGRLRETRECERVEMVLVVARLGSGAGSVKGWD
jgi:GNAT superfamily N-acetyltransferase